MITLVPCFPVFKERKIPFHIIVHLLSTSSLICGLSSRLPIAAPLTRVSRMLFSSVLRCILSLSSIPWSIKKSMVIKDNLLLTLAVQLCPGPWNCPSLPRTFPFFSRIKLPMSLITLSSTMQLCLMCSRPVLDWFLVYMWKSSRTSLTASS